MANIKIYLYIINLIIYLLMANKHYNNSNLIINKMIIALYRIKIKLI